MDSEEEEEEEPKVEPTVAAVKRGGEGRTRRPMKRVKYTFSDSEEDDVPSSEDDLFELD